MGGNQSLSENCTGGLQWELSDRVFPGVGLFQDSFSRATFLEHRFESYIIGITLAL